MRHLDLGRFIRRFFRPELLNRLPNGLGNGFPHAPRRAKTEDDLINKGTCDSELNSNLGLGYPGSKKSNFDFYTGLIHG